jgi:hypothetical protein
MMGMLVCLCLASQKPSEREFFIPARTDLGVKLLKRLPERLRWQYVDLSPLVNSDRKGGVLQIMLQKFRRAVGAAIV